MGLLLSGADDSRYTMVDRIVVDLRLPRMVLAIVVGGGLAVVGALLQTATRNDLSDPYLFGLSSGSAAGAVAVITLSQPLIGQWDEVNRVPKGGRECRCKDVVEPAQVVDNFGLEHADPHRVQHAAIEWAATPAPWGMGVTHDLNPH
jgi:hypothetical protein